MIDEIKIKNVATYGPTEEKLTNLKKINFLYGANATGKTTISRVIADESYCHGCIIKWKGEEKLETFVYNRDFIENNFNQSTELKGIFTLGEDDKNIISKISRAQNELNSIQSNIGTLKTTLEGEEGNKGKREDLAGLEGDFEKKCWDLERKHKNKFRDAFTGFMGRQADFKNKLISEFKTNTSAAVSLPELEKKAETIFGEAPQKATPLAPLNNVNLLAHESNTIMSKKIIGKSDVGIAALIEKLGNSDWVRQGRQFYDPKTSHTCPFCQQKTHLSLENYLNDYFDETFAADTAAISKLHSEYTADSEQIQQCIQMLIINPPKFFNTEKLQAESDILDSKIQTNIQRIKKKRNESSQPIMLDSLQGALAKVNTLIEEANIAINENNTMVDNLELEKTELTGQVWRCLLDYEIKDDLATFNRNKAELEKAIKSLEDQIVAKTREKQTKEHDIQLLERKGTSIQPTIDKINNCLREFGFTGFTLVKSDQNRFYKIQRPDGSSAKETLSEGEKSFICFLYFFHLLKGSESETGITSNRVVVFDDPVSSLDSDILFIVSTLIKSLFNQAENKNGLIKQVFILTHNVYFHKEVSFNSKRQQDKCLKEETFWTVRKIKQESKIQRHEKNPIKTSYELLWSELRNSDPDNLTIQNTMRRIIESYYIIQGNVSPDEICQYFEGLEKSICHSLFFWLNDGSHSTYDALYISIDNLMVEKYKKVFAQIFRKTNHIGHYNMMMGIEPTGIEVSGVGSPKKESPN